MLKAIHSEDSSLWALIQSDDEHAFTRFFNKYWDNLFPFAYKLLKNYDDAQEVVQIVFISIWERRKQLTITISFESYLYQAVRYQSLKKLEEILDNPQSVDRVHQELLPVFNEIWDRLHQQELFQEIEQQLSTLSSRTSEIFLLSRKHHLTISEIAARMGISEKTVRNQLHIALKTLRHSMAMALLLVEILH